MAACSRRFHTLLSGRFSSFSSVTKRNLSASRFVKDNRTYLWVLGGSAAAIATYKLVQYQNLSSVLAKPRRGKEDELAKAVKLTSRERRFIKFSSVEYNSQIYMTPQDFLESVVEAEPRPRLKRKILSKVDLDGIKDATPPLRRGTPQMFRNLRDKGIISYTEYLFLLSILTRPHTGFRIAFNMFDTDGNERVDKKEFLVIRQLLGGVLKREIRDANDALTQKALLQLIPRLTMRYEGLLGDVQWHLEKIFSHAWKDKRGLNTKEGEEDDEPPEEGEGEKSTKKDSNVYRPEDSYVDDEQGLQRRHFVETTLLVHFFGRRGRNELRYEDFKRFMENLQTEVLELEFHEFSKGLDMISEMDFARILLRYTYLDTDEYEMYLDRLFDRIKEEKGISFQDFKDFFQFLNTLEDFSIAMRMYTLADRPISQDEFQRAVKICTGASLSDHVVSTVFQIFDDDGDGQLSYREFIAIMKDRLHRGFKSYTKNEGWDAFKGCVKQEMKSQV